MIVDAIERLLSNLNIKYSKIDDQLETKFKKLQHNIITNKYKAKEETEFQRSWYKRVEKVL